MGAVERRKKGVVRVREMGYAGVVRGKCRVGFSEKRFNQKLEDQEVGHVGNQEKELSGQREQLE